MYHSNTLTYVKEHIQRDMSVSDGSIRILICTSAAGMGVNFAAVSHVVHYGPPYTTDSFVQQMGRAGRDGHPSHHLLLYCNRQRKGVDKELLTYISTSECRRKLLMSFYGSVFSTSLGHHCCDNCSQKCQCNDAECPNLIDHPLFHYYVDKD
jgi:superfamily II DNA helicase RecQ